MTGSGGSAAGTGGTAATGSGGSPGSGGSVGSGGSTASGGAPGTGGDSGSGGTVGTGGSSGTGGSGDGSGGMTGTGTGGGATGGAASGGTTGTGSGGRTGTGSGGTTGSGGRTGSGGSTGSGGATGTGGASGGATGKFSFFMTSLAAMRTLSGSQNGFGGDLRYGEANGLAGADKICATIAEKSMPGAGSKTWRAFLSVIGPPVVNAIDRVGEGPWYDRMGRLVASNKTQLMMQRPGDADPVIKNDLPNEDGVPNHAPDGSQVDNHDVLTGTGTNGGLYSSNPSNTCNDWTSSAATMPTGSSTGAGGTTGGMGGGMGRGGAGPWCGHSWPAGSGMNWMSALAEGGCGAGVNLQEMGGPQQGVYTVGTGGGYGAIYCFALTP